MVVVEFAYEEMKKLVDISREDMVEGLNNLGAPCEYEKETKKILAELTPNRPDWYSMEGLARALQAYYKRKKSSYKTKKSEYAVIVDNSVKNIRPYTVCAVAKGLKFNDERIVDMVLLQEKLLGTLGRKVKKFGIGIYPLEAIDFPVKYTAMKPEDIRYVPLGHGREMSANEIIKQHKKGQQYGHLISGFEKYPVFLDAKKRVMALVPVVNSAETGKVDVETQNVFVEVTGNDLNACNAALNILSCTFADMGGEIHEVSVDYGNRKIKSPDLCRKTVALSTEQANKILGTELNSKEIGGLLAKMDYEYAGGKVKVPAYRADVLGPIDVIEDIAIAYGYNNFRHTLPDFFSAGSRIDPYDSVDSIMRGMGFLEIKTFILTNREKLETVGYAGELVEILNPNNIEFTVVRPNLLADILDIFSNNKMKGLPQKYYEIGIAGSGSQRLVFGIMDKTLQLSDVRGYLQTLAKEMGAELLLEKTENKLFEEEDSCNVLINNKRMGSFGKVKKGVLDKFGLGFDIYICELVLDGKVQ
ncbi:phenylalanine--tRNA ligase subunit beta [Candidatus Micrarchaeota archaeon]|nr:phenylalanine--tRNA ligase subunit beta [Candidatus Micrarchaeota archaeon]